MDTNTFNNLISQTWPDLHAASTLGGGTFGTVYACTKTDAVTGVTQKEAVKVVRVDFTPEDRANAEEEGIPFADYYRAVKEKRLQEIRWMVALKSPHIVHINGYTAIEEPDHSALYILIRMDCLTALDQLRPAHLDDTPEQAAALAEKVALDICDALRVCHQNGVLHRDIKPANILCSDAGDFYLGDFGISKGTAQQASMTSSGTLEYAPREVMTGQYDHRADLYSLGLVLYALVNHWRGPFLPAYPAPITPGDRNQAQYARMNGTPLPPPDNCPAALWAVIARLCAFKPEERFDSAEAVLAALRNPGTPAPAQHRAHPNLPHIRHPRRLAAVVLVSAVAVGVGVGLYRRQQMAAPDISLGAERDSTDAALAQASDLLQGNENFMTAHNLQFCSDRTVTIPGGALVYLTDPEMSLDVGSVGKGYAVEMVAQAAEARGLTSALISVGGNLRAIGTKPDGSQWVGGVEDPWNASDVYTGSSSSVAAVKMSDLSLVTSGDYQRYYLVDGVRYHHLIDPATLWPAAYFDGVSVLAPDSGIADCLTTGLFCMPLEEGQAIVESLDGVEALWCTTDGQIVKSSGWDEKANG